MFRPYMVIIRLKHKKEINYTYVISSDIPVLYVSICVQCTYIEWDSLGKECDKSFNV